MMPLRVSEQLAVGELAKLLERALPESLASGWSSPLANMASAIRRTWGNAAHLS